MGNLCAVAKQLKATDEAELQRKLAYVRSVREHFTYEGTIKQLEKFFQDPLGPDGGELRCAHMPERAHRQLNADRLPATDVLVAR